MNNLHKTTIGANQVDLLLSEIAAFERLSEVDKFKIQYCNIHLKGGGIIHGEMAYGDIKRLMLDFERWNSVIVSVEDFKTSPKQRNRTDKITTKVNE